MLAWLGRRRGTAPARPGWEDTAAPAAIGCIALLGLFAVLYISWTPLRNPVIEGVQGRYFIPIALFAALAMHRPPAGAALSAAQRGVLALYSVVTLLIVPYTLLQRYY